MKLVLEKLLVPMPRALPVGMTSALELYSRIHRLVGPICSANDVAWIVSATIMRFGPEAHSASDRFFINTVRNAAAKQVAGASFQDIKAKQEAKAKEEAEKQQELTKAEATAPTEAASDGKETQNA